MESKVVRLIGAEENDSCWGGEGEQGAALNGYRVSVMQNENVPELCYTTMSM